MAISNLATKYRPTTFSELVGQDIAKTVLKKVAAADGIVARSIFLKGSFGSGKCISTSHRVATSQGYLKGTALVGSLQEGYIESSLQIELTDGSFSKVSHLYKESCTPCVRITEKYGKPFIGTPEHPVLALRRGRITPEFIKLSELHVGDYILHRKFSRLDLDFSLDFVKYFLYGYLLGDSCYSKSLKGNLQYKGIFKDVCWIRSQEEFRGCFKNNGGSYSIVSDKRVSDCFGYMIPLEKSMLNGLVVLGETAYTKTLHESVFTNKSVAFFTLCGLLASDGSVTQSGITSNRGRGCHKSPSFEFSTSSKLLSEGVCDLLDYLSINYTVKSRTSYYTYKGEYKIGRVSYRIIIPASFIHELKENFQQVYVHLNLPSDSYMKRVLEYRSFYSSQQINPVFVSPKVLSEVRKNFSEVWNPRICRGNDSIKCSSCRYGQHRTGRINSWNCSKYRWLQTNLKSKCSPVTISSIIEFLESNGLEFNSSKLITESLEQVKSLYSDYVYSEVLGIESTKDDVFDVTLPEGHIFMATNRVNHNTTLSKIFARAMNCSSFKETGDVCNECDGCKECLSQNSQLYWEFDSSVVGNVDRIRSLRESLNYVPQNGRRVVTLDEVHACSPQALNALLKIIEDGVPNTVFVFASTEDILSTIKSRSICLDISTIPYDLIKERVLEVAKKENISVTSEIADSIAIRSGGHMRDALSILQLFSLAGSDALKSSYSLMVDFFRKSLSKKKSEAEQLISALLKFNVVDVKNSIYLFIRNVYLADKDSYLFPLQSSGTVNKLFSYFFSPVSQQALKDEVGIELCLRAFLDKCCK